jgi:hypothetical protein
MKRILSTAGLSALISAGCGGSEIGKEVTLAAGGYEVPCDIVVSRTPLDYDRYCNEDTRARVEGVNEEEIAPYRKALECIFKDLYINYSVQDEYQTVLNDQHMYWGGISRREGTRHYGGLTVTETQGSERSIYAIITDHQFDNEGTGVRKSNPCRILQSAAHEQVHMLFREMETHCQDIGLDTECHEQSALETIMAPHPVCRGDGTGGRYEPLNFSFSAEVAQKLSELYGDDFSDAQKKEAEESLQNAGRRCRALIEAVF